MMHFIRRVAGKQNHRAADAGQLRLSQVADRVGHGISGLPAAQYGAELGGVHIQQPFPVGRIVAAPLGKVFGSNDRRHPALFGGINELAVVIGRGCRGAAGAAADFPDEHPLDHFRAADGQSQAGAGAGGAAHGIGRRGVQLQQQLGHLLGPVMLLGKLPVDCHLGTAAVAPVVQNYPALAGKQGGQRPQSFPIHPPAGRQNHRRAAAVILIIEVYPVDFGVGHIRLLSERDGWAAGGNPAIPIRRCRERRTVPGGPFPPAACAASRLDWPAVPPGSQRAAR